MDNVNFTGKFVKATNVLKNGNPVKASIIELSKQDLDKIETVAEKWDTKISYLIAKSFYFPIEGAKNPKVFAISTQDKDFAKLNPSKVLGMFEMTERKGLYALEYLEVNPKYTHCTPTEKPKRRTFSKIGKACIDYIKSRFKDRDIELYSVDSAKGFYEEMGFVPTKKPDCSRYLYKQV